MSADISFSNESFKFHVNILFEALTFAKFVNISSSFDSTESFVCIFTYDNLTVLNIFALQFFFERKT